MDARTLSILLLLLPLGGCLKAQPEEGIDDTIIRGTIAVLPETAEEAGDTEETSNDEVTAAEELPPLTWRELQVTGTSSYFGTITGTPGDADAYVLTSHGDGTLTATLQFVTDSSSGNDRTVYTLELYDLATSTEAAAATVTSEAGRAVASIPAAAGGTYVLRVIAGRTTEYETPQPYSLTVGSLVPTDDTFMVGAYLEPEPASKGAPVAGASVHDLAWDAARRAWIGYFEMLFVQVVVTDPQDTADPTAPRETTVTSTPDTVYLLAGTFLNLNASIGAGTLFSSQAVQVNPTDALMGGWGFEDDEDPGFDEDDTTDTADTGAPGVPTGEIEVAVDQVMPKVIGWEYTEVEPNDLLVTFENYGELDFEELMAAGNDLPVVSGPGFVDVIHGVQTFETAEPLWEGDVDVFEMSTGADSLGINVSLAWGSDADLDLLWYGPEGLLYGGAASLDNPEYFSTLDHYGYALDPETTYYLVVLGYVGEVGDLDYQVEIEYAAP